MIIHGRIVDRKVIPCDFVGFQGFYHGLLVLPPELAALTERLAEHAHDIWARQRLADGWTYGPKRDDGAKKHPCLIPYAQLPESEKEYDRQMAIGTLKAILALGYAVSQP